MHKQIAIASVSLAEAIMIAHALVLLIYETTLQAAVPTLAELSAQRVAKRFPSFYDNYIRPLYSDIVNDHKTLVPGVVSRTKVAATPK